MPVFNGSRFLENAFSNINRQRYQNIELCIVDDESTDDTNILANKLISRYHINGKVIKSGTRTGAEGSRDIACRNTRGAYIAQFDVDDEWDPEYLETMIAILNDLPRAGLVYSDFKQVNPDNGSFSLKSDNTPWVDLGAATRFNENTFLFEKGVFFRYLISGQVLFPPCTVYRRSLYESIGGYTSSFNQPVSMDWEFGLRAARSSAIAYLNKPLLNKLSHTGNVSGNSNRTALCDVNVIEHVMGKYIMSEEERSLLTTRYAARLFDLAYGLLLENDPEASRKYAIQSLRQRFSLKSLKTLTMSSMPESLRKLKYSYK